MRCEVTSAVFLEIDFTTDMVGIVYKRSNPAGTYPFSDRHGTKVRRGSHHFRCVTKPLPIRGRA
jgi:hypothetical protein